MDRAQLFDDLSHLPPQDFERLLVAVNMPRMNRAGASATIGEQVSAFLEWADSSIGPGLGEIQNYLDKMKSGSLPTAFDFSKYLQFLCRDPRCQDVRNLYTETEVLIPLEAETVQQKSPTANTNREAEQTQQKVKRFPVLEGLRKYALGEQRQHLLLAGRPGSGKSTTLKRLLLETVEAALEQPEVIPVYVQLKSDRSIVDLIIAEFRRAKVRVTSEQIDEWLFNDQLLLLLDGVNEIPSKGRRDELNAFREDNSATPMVFTTRDLAAGGELGIQKQLEMRPLSEPQMREFVNKYLAQRGLPDCADKLLRQLQDRLREIAETPLLLKMLCDVFDPATEKIPQSKGELFRLFDSQYDKFKGLVAVSDDFRRFKPELLQHLAFSMLQGDPAKPTEPWLTLDLNRAERLLESYLIGRVEAPGQRAKEWLEDLLEHYLLQVASDPKEVEFHHQLFQEYYAAEALLLKLSELLEDETKFKREYLNLLKWTEAIALMLALANEEAQALRVVKLAMDDVDLMLGARLAGEVKASLQPKTIGWIDAQGIPEGLKVNCWATSHSKAAIPGLLQALQDQNSDVRGRAAHALRKLGSEAAIPGLLQALQDQNWQVRGIAANALSEAAIPGLLQALQDQNWQVRGIAAKVLGTLGSEAAIPGLLQALQDQNWQVRGSAAYALGTLGSEAAIPGLLQALQDQNWQGRGSAADALGTLGSEAAIPGLLQALQDQDSDVRRHAADALETLGSEAAIPGLLQALQDQNWQGRGSAAYVLGTLGSEAAIPGLLQAVQDQDWKVRGSAAYALGNLGSEAVIPGLLQVLQDQNWQVCRSAAVALGNLGSEAAIPGLLQALQDQDSYVREIAADALGNLGNLGSEAAIPGLLQAVQDQDSDVRRSAADALGNLGSEAAIPGLLQALQDQDFHIRISAAGALGNLGSEAAIPGLLQALQHQDSDVRSRAADALAHLGSKAAIPGLLQALQHQDSYVREIAAYVLGHLGSEAAIPGLLQALQDQDSHVRSRAAVALGHLGSEAAIPGLLQALQHQGSDVRRSAAYVLGNLGSATTITDLWQLYLRQPEYYLEDAIFAIQDRCKFYNYDIWQVCLKGQQADSSLSQIDETIANTITIQTVERLTIMSDKAPIFNQQHATIGVNYAAEGSQQDFTQHIYDPEQNFEILLTGYKYFIDELQQQNPHITNETAIIQTIDIEARRTDARWQNFLNLKRLWNGGKKAAVKVGEHFVESNPWGKGAIAFLEGVSEDVK